MEVKVAQSILRSSESGGMQRCGGLSLLRERKEEGEEGRRGRRKEGEKEGEERSHRFSSNYLRVAACTNAHQIVWTPTDSMTGTVFHRMALAISEFSYISK